eukprot:987952-Amorphochlora_amoeboformis.AAC.2
MSSLLGGKSGLLLLASTVGAWWYISREMSRLPKRKPKVPLFRHKRKGCDDESEEEVWEDEKSLLTDSDSEEEMSPKKPRKTSGSTNGEGSPPEDTPTRQGHKRVDATKRGKVLSDLNSSHVNESTGSKDDGAPQSTPGSSANDVKEEISPKPQEPVRRLLIRTPTHTTEITRIPNKTIKCAESQRDSDMFYGFLSLYSKEAQAAEEPPKKVKRRTGSLVLPRDDLHRPSPDRREGDPFGDSSSKKRRGHSMIDIRPSNSRRKLLESL